MDELYKKDLHQYSLLTEAEILVQFEKDYDYPVSEIQLPPGYYSLEVEVRFDFDDDIEPEFIQEMLEQAVYVVKALALTEVVCYSGNEKWVKNAEYFEKVMMVLHDDIEKTK